MTLDYEPASSRDEWVLPWPFYLLLIGGFLLFTSSFGMLWYEGTQGDPPSFKAFKAYHYITAIGTLAGVVWLAVLMRCCWKPRWRWMIVVGAVWLCLMTALAGENLRDVHAHPAGQYYWQLWRGTAMP